MSMKTVYLARHGEAVSVGAPGVEHDFDRYLSDEGIQLMQHQAQGLARQAAPTVCYSSPLVRARQTATLLAEPHGLTPQLVNCLGDQPSLSQVHHLLHQSSERQFLLVTHQPFVVRLAAYLLGSNQLQLHYGTGTIARIDIYSLEAEPRGELVWLLTSEQMASLKEEI